ncbi:MAG TPA: tetratricopeptide repeat protein [Terriglobia bacterium]|nr:tetratricopeptide repeat protein [Terriglobia bacterium]
MERDYRKLLAFLDLSSGFTLAIARCNLPSLRREIVERARKDAGRSGVVVKIVDFAGDAPEDFVPGVRRGLDDAPSNGRLAAMVTGLDGLIYKSASPEELRGDGRPPFVARLNFDRERIAQELRFPIVLWLESESTKLLLTQAPDLMQWVSAHFDFGGPAVTEKAFSTLVESYPALDRQGGTETRAQLGELSGLLQELDETQGAQDAAGLRKRLAVLNALAERCYRLGDSQQAKAYWAEAWKIATKLKDRREEAAALGNLGIAYNRLGETRRAIECHEQALAIMREIGDRRGEGTALGNLGIAYNRLGETRRAIEYHEQALAIARELGNRRGEGNALGNLSNAYYRLGETRRAIEYYEQALAIDRELGNRRGEGHDLGNLGNAYDALGETRRAIEYYEQALAIARELGDRRGEGTSLNNLGLAYAALNETRRAIEYYEQALAIAREIGNRQGEGNALWNMSLALDTLGQHPKAIELAEAALKVYEQIEDPGASTVRSQLEQWRR